MMISKMKTATALVLCLVASGSLVACSKNKNTGFQAPTEDVKAPEPKKDGEDLKKDPVTATIEGIGLCKSAEFRKDSMSCISTDNLPEEKIDEAASSLAEEGYIIVAIAEHKDGQSYSTGDGTDYVTGYQLWAVKNNDSTASYEFARQRVSQKELVEAAIDLAQEGYVITTVKNLEKNKYDLYAIRQGGEKVAVKIETLVDDSDLLKATQEMTQEGYAPIVFPMGPEGSKAGIIAAKTGVALSAKVRFVKTDSMAAELSVTDQAGYLITSVIRRGDTHFVTEVKKAGVERKDSTYESVLPFLN